MLSDEEKEALDKLSSKKNETTWDDTIRQIKREEIRDVVVTRQKYITAVLNLIEKQSKEIEELNKSLMTATLKIEGLKIEAVYNDNYISKDKIKEVLGIENTNETAILKYIETIVDENARLEDIEDRKVQIEYNNVFNKGVKSVEDKIKAKIEEVKDGTFDAKIVLQSLLEKE